MNDIDKCRIDIEAKLSEFDKRLSKQEWDHEKLSIFAKQIHTDQTDLKDELAKISMSLSQIKWMAVGALALWLVSKGEFNKVIGFLF